MMIDQTTATTEEIMAAVERWARTTWLLFEAPLTSAGHWSDDLVVMARTIGWRMSVWPDKTHIWHRHGMHDNAVSKSWHVDPATALVWALCFDAGLTVDVGRCSACEGCGRKCETTPGWSSEASAKDAVWRLGHVVLAVKHDEKDAWTATYDTRCTDCSGTGRDIREAAQLVLDIQTVPGDQATHASLAILADLHHGTPAGHALAHWLRLWLHGDLRETRAAVAALNMRTASPTASAPT